MIRNLVLRPGTLNWVLCFALLICFMTQSAFAADQAGTPVTYRGIAISMYKRPTQDDFTKIRSWGVNFVRLVIQADPEHGNYDSIYLPDGVTPNEAAFANLDKLVALAAKNRIAVDICLLTFPGVLNHGIWRDYRYWDQLEKLWVFIATRYRNIPAVVAYELMNEPRLVKDEGGILGRLELWNGSWEFPDDWKNTPKDYFGLVERIGQAINRIDPDKMVIVPVLGSWGNPINFKWMRPVNVQNVVYTFHMYIPNAFGDSGKLGRPVVSYDSTKSRAVVIDAMENARRFAEKYKARIFVGELGLPYYTEGMGAASWLRDVLGYIEQQGWSWSYWIYSIPFRDPEIVLGAKGDLEKHEDSERLTVLKQYWKLNSTNQTGNVNVRD